MIGLKKILAVLCIVLHGLTICSIYSSADALTENQVKQFQAAHVDKPHASSFTDFAMELIEERTEKTTPDFSDPAYHYKFLKEPNNQFSQHSVALREFYSSRIKSITSESSFLMIFRI